MKKGTIGNEQSGIYKPGLDKESEAVISAHFMHDINQNVNLKLYSTAEFAKRALPVSPQLIIDHLLPLLLDASDKFILERASAAKKRAKQHFKEYGLNSSKNVGLSEMLAEVMFDRQFLKGSKSNFPRLALSNKIRTFVEKQEPIKMAIPALPYKSSSPLKSRGTMPDLSEINFLLGLAEIAKTLEVIYRDEMAVAKEGMARFTVISDGSRFNNFLNEPDSLIKSYQEQLRWWIDKLGISNYVNIIDYQELMSKSLPPKMVSEKKEIREKVRVFYTELMFPLLKPYSMLHTINQAIELDPEPELSNPEGRFIPLFKSLIYIVRYRALLKYADLHGKDYVDLYTELTRHIFEPYIELSTSDFAQAECFISNPKIKNSLTQTQLFEYLRQTMLAEAWEATINYVAEIRSDRDLGEEPIVTSLPDHIRWTIHAKSGQLAILTTTAFGDPVQPWHGVGVFMLTKNNKIKLYTLPILLLEGLGAVPVTVVGKGIEHMIKDQPLFYVNPEIKFDTIDDLLEKIKQNLTRKRKL